MCMVLSRYRLDSVSETTVIGAKLVDLVHVDPRERKRILKVSGLGMHGPEAGVKTGRYSTPAMERVGGEPTCIEPHPCILQSLGLDQVSGVHQPMRK